MCIRIVSIQNGCVTCHLFCWLLVNVYKYAIKHFNSVFFSLYCIFDIVQCSVDAVYIAGALFEDRLGLDAGQVCPQTLYFKGLSCPRQEQLGESSAWRGNLRSVRGGRAGSLLRPCPTGAAIHSLAHFRGGLPLWRAPESASWAISCSYGCCRKGAEGGQHLEKGRGTRDRRMFAGGEQCLL